MQPLKLNFPSTFQLPGYTGVSSISSLQKEECVTQLCDQCNKVIENPNGSLYSDQIRSHALLLMGRLRELQNSGANPDQLYLFATNSLNNLTRMINTFEATKTSFQQQTKNFMQTGDALKTSFQSRDLQPTLLQYTSTSNVTSTLLANLPDTKASNLNWDPYQQEILDQYKSAEIATVIVNAVDDAIASTVSDVVDNVKRHASAICNRNSQIKKNCQVMADFATSSGEAIASASKAAVDYVADIPLVKNLVNVKIDPPRLNMPEIYEKHYGIPKATTQQHLNNCAAIIGFALTTGIPGGKPLQAVKSQMKAAKAGKKLLDNSSHALHQAEKSSLQGLRPGYVKTAESSIQKRLLWEGGSKNEYLALPKAVQKEMGHALLIAQRGGMHESCKPINKFFKGKPVNEVVQRSAEGSYRTMYTVNENAVHILGSFKKESSSGIKTAQRHIDRAEERLKKISQGEKP